MKAVVISLVASMALAGCALNSGAPLENAPAAAQATTTNAPDFLTRPPDYTSALVAENQYEVMYAGRWQGSRDAIEGGLLYRAALLAKEKGMATFRFIPMPGETGPLSHPSRVSPSFGASYGHWQPHWSYRTEAGWQPWHPEWGDRFWADRLTKGDVKWVEVHAMVELRAGPPSAGEQTDFAAAAVLRDLRRFNQ